VRAEADNASVIISEVMWMGSDLYASDEWVEIACAGMFDCDLAGWSLTSLKSTGEEAVIVSFSSDRIIPAGGGTKEMTMRASDKYFSELPELPELQKKFMNIAMAKVSTSAKEAFDMEIFKNGRDSITINPHRVIADAKESVLAIANKGYTRPSQREDIKVLGRSALATLLLGAYSFNRGHYISDHDKKIVEKLAFIMCGGDLSEGTFVSEQYLLDLEREAFLSLITEKKTLERIQSILTTGKPLRN